MYPDVLLQSVYVAYFSSSNSAAAKYWFNLTGIVVHRGESTEAVEVSL